MTRAVVPALLAQLVVAPAVFAQEPAGIDPVREFPGQYTVVFENEHVRVVEYALDPGERDGTHTHPPKVSYVLAGGTLRIAPEGADPFLSEEKAGGAHWSDAVGRHAVENVGATTVRILLVEPKCAEEAEADAR